MGQGNIQPWEGYTLVEQHLSAGEICRTSHVRRDAPVLVAELWPLFGKKKIKKKIYISKEISNQTIKMCSFLALSHMDFYFTQSQEIPHVCHCSH